MAPKLNIRAVDTSALDVLESALGADRLGIDVGDTELDDRASALWGLALAKGQRPTNTQVALQRLYQYLQYWYWMLEEHRNIQNIIDRLELVAPDLHPSDLRSKYLVHVALQRLTLSVLQMASAVAGRDVRDVKRQGRIYMYGGPLALREREQTITYLNMLDQNNTGITEKISLDPEYFDELIEIINRLIIKSAASSLILQHLDAVLVSLLLGGTVDIKLEMGDRYSTDALVLSKRIATMLQRASGLDPSLLEELASL